MNGYENACGVSGVERQTKINQPVRQPELESAFGTLYDRTNVLGELLSTLRSRLEPVLRQCPSDGACNPVAEYSSVVAVRIASQASNVDGANAIIRDILDRLEI